MWGSVKAVPEVTRTWRDNRGRLYDAAASVAAALVVPSVVVGTRPSDSLAAAARSIGLTSAAAWFGPAAPPLVAERVEWLQEGAMTAVLLLVMYMIFAPLRFGHRDDVRSFPGRSLLLLGSPAAATVWLLLLGAAQQGDITPDLQQWVDAVLAAVAGVGGVLVVGGGLYLFTSSRGLEGTARRLLRTAAVLPYRLCGGLGLALVAIALAGLAFPLSIVRWMCALESDKIRTAYDELWKERAERTPVPTGARVAVADAS